MTNPELIRWLNEQMEERNLSQSETSRRAGLGPNAISEIVNGRTPGLKVSKAIASVFSVSPETILRLAGHLPPLPTNDDLDPEIRYRLQDVVSFH